MGHYSASTRKYLEMSKTPDGQLLSFLQKVTWIILALQVVLGSMLRGVTGRVKNEDAPI